MVSARITTWGKIGHVKLDLSQRGQSRVPMTTCLGVKRTEFLILSWSSSLTQGGPFSRDLRPRLAKDALDRLEEMILT